MENNNEIKIGTIFSASWGYNMTNVNFYKVVKMTAKTVTLIELDIIETYSDKHAFTGTCMPSTQEKGVPIRNRRFAQLQPEIRDSRFMVRIDDIRRAYQWDGKPEYFNYCD